MRWLRNAVFKEEVYLSENGSYYHDPITGLEKYDPELDIIYYPPASKTERPEWLRSVALQDDTLGQLLNQLYRALDTEIDILAAIGIRTTFDRVSELIGIDTSLRFEERLGKLLSEGYIGETGKDIFSILIDAGNAAAHRGWRPETEDLDSLMNILEQFIDRNLHTRRKIEKISERIPSRKPRK